MASISKHSAIGHQFEVDVKKCIIQHREKIMDQGLHEDPDKLFLGPNLCTIKLVSIDGAIILCCIAKKKKRPIGLSLVYDPLKIPNNFFNPDDPLWKIGALINACSYDWNFIVGKTRFIMPSLKHPDKEGWNEAFMFGALWNIEEMAKIVFHYHLHHAANLEVVWRPKKKLKGKYKHCDAFGCALRNYELKELGQKLRKCSRCKSAYYCSKRCQKRHWRGHRYQCFRP